jgi:hypothetical protein
LLSLSREGWRRLEGRISGGLALELGVDSPAAEVPNVIMPRTSR